MTARVGRHGPGWRQQHGRRGGREQDVRSGGVSRYLKHMSSASQSNVGNVYSMSITAEHRTDRLVRWPIGNSTPFEF